jgi:teichuronic acid biosynthesis glycosyltransferase TuaC
MYPSARRPALGAFVRDQVEALRGLGAEVEVFAFAPGGRAYLRACRDVRGRHGSGPWDVVHAHFGLSALPALAVPRARRAVTLHGTDLEHARSGPVSRLLLRAIDLPAVVSGTLAARVPGAGVRRRVAVLPCGVDLDRFRPLPRRDARARLGLRPTGRYLLFPADPSRAAKRADRARTLAAGVGAELLVLSSVAPADVPLWVNAANAVVVPSEREGFGLAVLEALACDVPVLATPVGVHPLVLGDLAGTLCEPWDAAAWSAAVTPLLDGDDPRVAGRARAALFSARRMAARVLVAWEDLAAEGTPPTRPYTQPQAPGGAVAIHERPSEAHPPPLG